MNVQGTTACWPGYSHREALLALHRGTYEPWLGRLGITHVPLCPQNRGRVDEETAVCLRQAFPRVRFRLHANVRVCPSSRHGMGDAASCEIDSAHFKAIARVSALLEADAYTLHAGARSAGTPESVRAAVLALEERLGIPVGVEPMYPDPKQTWLLSSWDEYRWLLESDIRYALDLSHLNILARRSRWTDYGLTGALLAHPRCIEIHVSDNDGHCDHHALLTRAPWWWGCLEEAAKLNPGAVIFSEGNQLRRKPRP